MENIQSELHRFLFNGEGYYNWGISLLRRLGHDGREIAQFERYSQDTYAPTHLEQKMESILRGYYTGVLDTPQHQPIIQGIENSYPEVENTIPKNDIEPPVITSLRNEVKVKLKLRADWHSQMCITKSQEDRAHCAEQIFAVTSDLNRIYGAIDNYTEFGIIPPHISAIELANDSNAALEIASLRKEEISIAPRISKIRKLLKGDLPQNRRSELELELKDKKARLNVIRAKNNSINC